MSTKLYRNKSLNKSTKVDSIWNSSKSTKLTPNKSMEFDSNETSNMSTKLYRNKTLNKSTKVDSIWNSSKSTKFNSLRHLISLWNLTVIRQYVY